MIWNAQLKRFKRILESVLPWAANFVEHFIGRFPFSIIYAERDGLIVIIAVAHQRKRPGYWRGRQ